MSVPPKSSSASSSTSLESRSRWLVGSSRSSVLAGRSSMRATARRVRPLPRRRGSARAVGADQRAAVAALDVEVHAPDNAVRAVRLPHVFQLEHHAAAFRAVGEMEVDALPLGRDLDRNHLLEHLDPALDLRRLRRLITEAVDERLHPLDLVVLVALLLAQPLHALVAF